MRMEASLRAQQEMRMRLAPQIIQSIEILQLPLFELRQRIDQELLENPVLEQALSEEEAESKEESELEASTVEAPSEESVDDVTVDEEHDEEQFERLEDLTDYYSEFNETGPSRRYSSGERDPKQEAFENSPAPDPTLQEHLEVQLGYEDIDAPTREACRNIIANLDDRGYLAYPLAEITASMDSEISEEQAQEALRIVQSFEPPGVGARDMEECLLLQLDAREPDYEFLRRLIHGHFDDILQNRYPKVAQAMGCSVEELKVAVEKITRLNPIPGALFGHSAAPHVLPDVRVEEVDGEWTVILEDSWLPSLGISSYYARRLSRKDVDPKVRDYLREKFHGARGLISAIEQRRSTLYRVASDIVERQREFFEQGGMHLKPLKMQEVADRVGVHVSTVSRAISDKYAQTPHGIYSLKHFFTGGVQKEDGDMESWEVVRQKLLDIVENEDKKNPLSDEAIAEKLQQQGIDIARRTVSKYRKNLDVPSSRLRKEY
jgi:RNA polymerase sigma-54 factor